ncbi:MAG: hypothetical protein ACD_19C00426G0131 [uncultured bacterium]|nr:MAG: hypothetical protein ACD_19C00426G0131 [uncultured bacterium]
MADLQITKLPNDDIYERTKAERQKHVDEILNSTSKKKIVVAGPGTGKTYLFKEILKNKTKALTLTFVNSLVADLSLELYGLSEVRTLHSYARSILGKLTKKDIKVFSKLSSLISEDAKIILEKDIDFNALFYDMDDQNELISFYKTRKDYYGDYYGFTDIIYAAVKLLQTDKTKTPIYEQVLIDEFQDFNKLEVSLIELLAEKNPILLAGDDDQALYGFKKASVEHVRNRHSDNDKEFASFSLPFCSRCTRVIVDSVNDIVESATKEGKLVGRIKKEYKYFDDKDKDKVCSKNPYIFYKALQARQIPWFIKSQIKNIAEETKGRFSVLIISPTRIQTRDVAKGLMNWGFQNVEYTEKEKPEVTLIDGLLILLDDQVNNLGWRISVKHLLSQDEFEVLLKKTGDDNQLKIAKMIDLEYKNEILGLLSTLRKLKNGKSISKTNLDYFMAKVNINSQIVSENYLKDKIFPINSGDPATQKIPIKVTTIQSSKGLSDEYVFITHFDDKYFIQDKESNVPTDQEICNFLVALTRAKKRVYLVSTNIKNKPKFLKWINSDRIEELG